MTRHSFQLPVVRRRVSNGFQEARAKDADDAAATRGSLALAAG